MRLWTQILTKGAISLGGGVRRGGFTDPKQFNERGATVLFVTSNKKYQKMPFA